ncbi:MAG: hypothetical protein MAG431_00293 [Chloroflexi bacterium]|nr:hypothetical protein [Chloroflexota bacterium]
MENKQVKESTSAITLSVPWTARDVWLGVASLGVWWIIFWVAAFWIGPTVLQENLGLAMGVWELALVIPAWWFTIRKYKSGWSQLGFRGFRGETIALGGGLLMVSFAFNLAYNLFLALFNLQAQADLVPVLEAMSSPGWLMITGIVIAPIAEEIVFRGFFFSGLKQRYGWVKAALISSGLFAVLHLQPLAMLPIFILGFLFAYLYHKSKSIWPGVVLHVTMNSLALGAAYTVAKLGF